MVTNVTNGVEMAAVKRISKEKIIDAAVDVIRRGGQSALNARNLAKRLGCSTRPIYLAFKGMDGVKKAAAVKITRVFEEFIAREVVSGRYPVYKSYGMAYIRFALEERELFKSAFMTEQTQKTDSGYGGVIDAVMKTTGLDRERAELFHLENWIFVHGLASMVATGFTAFDEETFQKVLTDAFEGLKARFKIK